MAAAAVTLPGSPILDPHVHVWKHDPEFPFAPGAKVPAFDATPEMLIELMKANGIQKTVIIQVIHFLYDNSSLAAVLKQYPQYFRGVCRVDPTDPDSPDQLSEITAQPGFSGRSLEPGCQCQGRLDHGPADAASMESLRELESANDPPLAHQQGARCPKAH